jgi:uncharacterized protein
VIRRLTLSWPRPSAQTLALGRPVRLLAVSDERERALSYIENRDAIAPLDAVVGCGDLEPDYLSFLADAFAAPLLFVRGNHDRGGAWEETQQLAPAPLAGPFGEVAGIPVAGLSWPSFGRWRAERDERSAWRQALSVAVRGMLPGPAPRIVLSHVPPRGYGDTAADPYHTGFDAYRWLCRWIRPTLWLHGHTTVAAIENRRTVSGPTTLLNVTGAVFIELQPAPRWPEPGAGRAA